MASRRLAILADDIDTTTDESQNYFRDYHPSEIFFPYSKDIATTNIHAWLFIAILDIKIRAIDSRAISAPHQLTRLLPEINPNYDPYKSNITFLASLDSTQFARQFIRTFGADGFNLFQTALSEFRDLYSQTHQLNQVFIAAFEEQFAHLFYSHNIAEYTKEFDKFYDEHYQPSASFKRALFSLAVGETLDYSVHLWAALMPRKLTVIIAPDDDGICQHNIWIPKGHNLECARCGYTNYYGYED